MKVHDLNLYSDHCMLTTKNKNGFALGYDEDICSDDSFVNLFPPDMYICLDFALGYDEDICSDDSFVNLFAPDMYICLGFALGV